MLEWPLIWKTVYESNLNDIISVEAYKHFIYSGSTQGKIKQLEKLNVDWLVCVLRHVNTKWVNLSQSTRGKYQWWNVDVKLTGNWWQTLPPPPDFLGLSSATDSKISRFFVFSMYFVRSSCCRFSCSSFSRSFSCYSKTTQHEYM